MKNEKYKMKDEFQNRTLDFAVRIVKFYKYLCDIQKEHVISKQILRSGTSIGANVRESKNAQTNPDYITKLSIALKEADETQYWLEVLLQSEISSQSEFDYLNNDLKPIIAILVSSIKTLRCKKE
jgi:four helix bundle protein